jgi:hypothetical protein
MDNNSSNELFKMFVKYSVPFYEKNQDGQITEVKKGDGDLKRIVASLQPFGLVSAVLFAQL